MLDRLMYRLMEFLDHWYKEMLIVGAIGILLFAAFAITYFQFDDVELKGPMTDKEVEVIARRVYAEERLKELNGE